MAGIRVRLVQEYKGYGISDNDGKIEITTWKLHDLRELKKIGNRLIRLLKKSLDKE